MIKAPVLNPYNLYRLFSYPLKNPFEGTPCSPTLMIEAPILKPDHGHLRDAGLCCRPAPLHVLASGLGFRDQGTQSRTSCLKLDVMNRL